MRITYSLDHSSNCEFSALLQREDDEFGVYLHKQSINIRKDINYGSSKDWYLFAFCLIDNFTVCFVL